MLRGKNFLTFSKRRSFSMKVFLTPMISKGIATRVLDFFPLKFVFHRFSIFYLQSLILFMLVVKRVNIFPIAFLLYLELKLQKQNQKLFLSTVSIC